MTRHKRDSSNPPTRKKSLRRYPEEFFLALIGKELSDIQYANAVLSAILTIANHSNPTKEKRYEIMTDYYVKGLTLKEIGAKNNLSHSRIRQIILQELHVLQSYLIHIQVPISSSDTLIVYDWNLNTTKYQYPSSYAEFYAHLEEQRKEKESIELEQRSEILYPDTGIEKLSFSFPVFTRLIKNRIRTVGDFMSLTSSSKLYGIGEKYWAEIRVVQEEASKHYHQTRE